MPDKKRVKKNPAFLFNNQAVTLLELVVIITVLAVIAVVATVKINNAVKQAIRIKEEAIVRMLSKAAVNYNTINEDWYGQNNTDDIFVQFLDSPPQHLPPWPNGSAHFTDAPDNVNWRLLYYPGPPVYWAIQCPHYMYALQFANRKGCMWEFRPVGGKVIKSPLSGQH